MHTWTNSPERSEGPDVCPGGCVNSWRKPLRCSDRRWSRDETARAGHSAMLLTSVRARMKTPISPTGSGFSGHLSPSPTAFRPKALSEQLLAMISASASDNRSSERLSLIDRRTVEASAKGNYRLLAASPSPSCSRRLSGSARSVLFRRTVFFNADANRLGIKLLRTMKQRCRFEQSCMSAHKWAPRARN